MDEERVEQVLQVVEQIPPGRVATYGDIAAVVGESPRWVGRVMAEYGSNVAWWRVVNVKGQVPGHDISVKVRWKAEKMLDEEGKLEMRRVRLALSNLNKPCEILGNKTL